MAGSSGPATSAAVGAFSAEGIFDGGSAKHIHRWCR